MLHLSDSSRLCFAVAVTCLVMGAIGAIANLLIPGSTTLDALLIVAVFYAALGCLDLSEVSGAVNCEDTNELCQGHRITNVDCNHGVQPESVKRAA